MAELTKEKFRPVDRSRFDSDAIVSYCNLLAGCMETIEEKSSCNGITCRAWTDFNYGYCWTIY